MIRWFRALLRLRRMRAQKTAKIYSFAGRCGVQFITRQHRVKLKGMILAIGMLAILVAP